MKAKFLKAKTSAMGLMKDFKKAGVYKIGTGFWDKENNVFMVGEKKFSVVEKISKPFMVNEAYGSGGWIEGYERVEKRNTFHFVYDNETLIGFISEYNVMFPYPNKYHLIYINEINKFFNL